MSLHSKTLTIRLMGGLGNQLFQYAFGRRLALANQADLLLDISGYPALAEVDPIHGGRSVELSSFNIVARVIQNKPESRMLGRSRRVWGKVARGLMAVMDLSRPYYARREIVEPTRTQFHFDRQVYDRTFEGNLGVRGFWQSEKYFEAIDRQLRAELTLRNKPAPRTRRLAAAIRATTSVAVHVRHGDNANSVAAALGMLPRGYYAQAVATLKKALRRPNFFVFSDDLPWAMVWLRDLLPNATAVHDPDRAAEDLWLMSLCGHHILANSTFAWWAAWLGRKPGQIVYAPRRYYQNVDRANPDLYPPDWRLI